MLSEKADGKIMKWRKDGATRQRDFKDAQRAMGRRRAEYWLTDSERAAMNARLDELRAKAT